MRNERQPVRPLAVIAWPDVERAAALARLLSFAGWRVLLAESAARARRLTGRLAPSVVVLAAGLPDESGWLTCAKLQRCRRKPRVVLIDDEEAPGRDRFAAFVGAAVRLPGDVSVRTLAKRVAALAPVPV
jgi:DNA-binding response OmpR family regulator